MRHTTLHIGIFLIAVYTVGLLQSFAPYLEYGLNYTYIKNVLCENKAKPQLSCHGKCHLKKRIKEEKKKTEKTVKLKAEQVDFMQEHTCIVIEPLWESIDNSPDYCYFSFCGSTISEEIFHPPILLQG